MLCSIPKVEALKCWGIETRSFSCSHMCQLTDWINLRGYLSGGGSYGEGQSFPCQFFIVDLLIYSQLYPEIPSLPFSGFYQMENWV